MPSRDLRALLEEGLAALPVAADSKQREQLAALAELLAEWGRTTNLTGHRGADAIARHLVLDAAALLGCLPHFQRLADLGSGAGFPGLPMAILRPDAEVFLVEARERRHYFQRAAVRELGIRNAFPIRGRLEVVSPRRASVVVAQAVGPIDRVIGWMLPWASPAGDLVVPTSRASPEPRPLPGLPAARREEYRVPPDSRARYFWRLRAPAPGA